MVRPPPAPQHIIKGPYTVPTFSREEVKQVTDYTGKALGKTLPRGWRVEFVDTYLVGKDTNGIYFADGATDPYQRLIIVFAYNSCLADSSLIHEVAHALGYHSHTKDLYKHLTVIQKQAIKDLCPEGYVSGSPPDPSLMKNIIKNLHL
jgi:hypothetical protein